VSRVFYTGFSVRRHVSICTALAGRGSVNKCWLKERLNWSLRSAPSWVLATPTSRWFSSTSRERYC